MLPIQTNQINNEMPSQVYTPPAIIYQGQISTRAGSPIGPIAPSDDGTVDPIDLFGDHQSE